MDKIKELLKLAEKRKSFTYNGYTAIGDYNNGSYECDYVSPFSISAHNIDADIMVILQDWCSEEGFGKTVDQETLKYGYTPSVKTNVNLKKLLFDNFNLGIEDTYATNLFPFIKYGEMNARIPAKDLLSAALDFSVPMIDIIQPKLVICLGKDTFNAIRKACRLKVVYSIDEAVNSHFSYKNTEIFGMAHTGMLGKNNRNRGGVDRVTDDWNMMIPYI